MMSANGMAKEGGRNGDKIKRFWPRHPYRERCAKVQKSGHIWETKSSGA
jgi:hypothetical protein